MPRLSVRDLVTIAAFVGPAAIAALLTIAGRPDWAVVVVAILVALLGAVARIEFAARRDDVREQKRNDREVLRLLERLRTGTSALRAQLDEVRKSQRGLASAVKEQRSTLEVVLGALIDDAESGVSTTGQIRDDLTAVRSELRGMRVAQQLLSQTITSTKQTVGSTEAALENLHGAQSTLHELVESVNASVLASRDEVFAAIAEPAGEIQSRIALVESRTRTLAADIVNDQQALLQLLPRHLPTAPLPILAGWAMSPEGLVHILDQIDRRDAKCVVECGSGSSTLWMALAMKAKGSGIVISLEHNEAYANKTRAVLDAHGVGDWARVAVCPLTTVETERGEFQWYDLQKAEISSDIDILLVDGPPGATGRWARYPALPLLREQLRHGAPIFIDDADRVEERETIEFWIEEGLVDPEFSTPWRGVSLLSAASAE